jgi:hypothetical protein
VKEQELDLFKAFLISDAHNKSKRDKGTGDDSDDSDDSDMFYERSSDESY